MPLKTESIEEPDLNLTPMIDIVFLLIIFFMVGTQFSEMERQYDVKLPTVSDAQPLTSLPDEIIVNIREDGTIVVDQKDLTIDDLEALLLEAKRRYADQAVLVRGDADGRYQRIMEVLEICHRAKISLVSLGNRLQDNRSS